MNMQLEQMAVETLRSRSRCIPPATRDDSQPVTSNLPIIPHSIGQIVYEPTAPSGTPSTSCR